MNLDNIPSTLHLTPLQVLKVTRDFCSLFFRWDACSFNTPYHLSTRNSHTHLLFPSDIHEYAHRISSYFHNILHNIRVRSTITYHIIPITFTHHPHTIPTPSKRHLLALHTPIQIPLPPPFHSTASQNPLKLPVCQSGAHHHGGSMQP